jgi:hypothetical protein
MRNGYRLTRITDAKTNRMASHWLASRPSRKKIQESKTVTAL